MDSPLYQETDTSFSMYAPESSNHPPEKGNYERLPQARRQNNNHNSNNKHNNKARREDESNGTLFIISGMNF